MIGTEIENFWITHDTLLCQLLGETLLWTYGKAGIQLWKLGLDNHIPQQPISITSRETASEFDSNVCPIGINTSTGSLIGVEQSFHDSRFEFAIKSQTYLPAVLKYLIETDLTKAIELACAIYDLPMFDRILELLLYQVLEEKEAQKTEEKAKLLKDTVRIIHKFPSFAEIVTMCARKIDVTLWKSLFDAIGSPKALLEVLLLNKFVCLKYSFVLIFNHSFSFF